jgi:hypothetical protein
MGLSAGAGFLCAACSCCASPRGRSTAASAPAVARIQSVLSVRVSQMRVSVYLAVDCGSHVRRTVAATAILNEAAC